MHGRCLGMLLILGSLALFGCAPPTPAVTESEAIALLRSGRPVLHCREACLAAWQRVEPQAEQLAREAKWGALAALILGVDYQDDLTLYYLGRSAEALGFRTAATSFYGQSIPLTGTSISCANLSRLCAGVSLPQDALLRLASLRRPMSRPPRRRPGEPRGGPASAEPGAIEEPASIEEPPPPPSLPQPAPPAPPERSALPPRAPGPAESDYIEPPPARR